MSKGTIDERASGLEANLDSFPQTVGFGKLSDGEEQILRELFQHARDLISAVRAQNFLKVERILARLRISRQLPMHSVAEKLERSHKAHIESQRKYWELRGPVKPPERLSEEDQHLNEYPEHRKLPPADYRAALGRVLEWLSSEGLRLCYYEDYEKNGGSGGTWRPKQGLSENDIIAKAHGARPRVLEEERREMMRTFLEGQQPST